MKWGLTILLTVIIQISSAQEKEIPVSFIHLISNPEKFEGKLLRVSGFMHVKPEDIGLYFSKESADYLMSESIWISFDSSFVKRNNIKTFDSKYVELVGIFDKNEKGHISGFQGSLKSVSKMRKLKKWY
jgi:hypothetical protein